MKYVLKTTGYYGRKSAIFGLLTISCLVSTFAFAQVPKQQKQQQQNQQAGPRDGAGGASVRLDIVAVRNFIYEMCEKIDSLKRENVDCAVLRAKMDEVGLGEDRLRIEETVALADGKSRDGVNRHWIPDITFGETKWLEAKDDSIRKIGIVLHEFLGLLQIEGTDDYYVSSQVVNEIRMKGLTSFLPEGKKENVTRYKKWATDFIKKDHPRTFHLIEGVARGIKGLSTNGHGCAFHVTDKHLDEYYLAIGVSADKNYEYAGKLNSYIGGFGVEELTVYMPNAHEIYFRTIREKGVETVRGKDMFGKFYDASLKIELTDTGRVVRVTGKSTLVGDVICNFK